MSDSSPPDFKGLATAVGLRLNVLCECFEEAWQRGERPAIAHFLCKENERAHRQVLVRELILLDVYYRHQTGEKPRPEDYVAQFPEAAASWLNEVVRPTAAPVAAIKSAPNSPSAAATCLYPNWPDRAGPEGRRIFGAYEIVEEVAHGGMGIVFRAVDPRLHRQVALKVMWPQYAASPEARERFLREARAAAAFEHDHIVTVHEVNETPEGALYLVMPFLAGESLDSRLKRAGALPLSEILRLAREICAGLAAAHARGLVHRDIKPSNIWLEQRAGSIGTPDGARAKLLDFGLARTAGTSELTLPGTVSGTPSHMSPEQSRGEELDARSDLFSFGCVLYQMTTGQAAFRGETAQAVVRAIQEDQPPSPASLRPDCPDALCCLIEQLLAKDRNARPASADAVYRALRANVAIPENAGPLANAIIPAGAPTASDRPPEATRQPRHWLRRAVAVACGILLLLAAAGGYALLRGGMGPPPLKGSIDVLVIRGPEGKTRALRLDDPDVLPLRSGSDHVRIEVRLNRPAFIYVAWIDTEGKADLLYPLDKQHQHRPVSEELLQELFLPSSTTAAELGAGPAGTETLLLLARDERLPLEEDIPRLLAGLPPQRSAHPREAAWFENGILVKGEHGRAPINFDDDRGKPRFTQTQEIEDPVLRNQALLSTRLRAKFTYSRAVCFSSTGNR